MAAETGLMLPETLNSTLDCVPDGKSKVEMPVLVVTASETAMGDDPPSST